MRGRAVVRYREVVENQASTMTLSWETPTIDFVGAERRFRIHAVMREIRILGIAQDSEKNKKFGGPSGTSFGTGSSAPARYLEGSVSGAACSVPGPTYCLRREERLRHRQGRRGSGAGYRSWTNGGLGYLFCRASVVTHSSSTSIGLGRLSSGIVTARMPLPAGVVRRAARDTEWPSS